MKLPAMAKAWEKWQQIFYLIFNIRAMTTWNWAMTNMRMHAKAQYDKLLTGPYGDFQVDCEAVDDMIAPTIPQSTRIEITQDLGKAIWGLHPLLDSARAELFLPEMIRRLDAIVKWCDAGNEFDIWCEFNDATGEIATDADDE